MSFENDRLYKMCEHGVIARSEAVQSLSLARRFTGTSRDSPRIARSRLSQADDQDGGRYSANHAPAL